MRHARSRASAPLASGIWAARLLTIGVLVAGCTAQTSSSDPPSTPTGRASSPTTGAMAWRPVDLPLGELPVTLTAYRDGVLVGTQDGTTAAPALLRLDGSSIVAVSVHPVTPYAAQATWLSIASESDGRLVAVAGARGGAHSNVRWSVWRGDTTTGLSEQEQPFSTFGGWGAGEQLGVLMPSTGPLLLGSWESRGAGLDADIWEPVGATWVRQDPTGSVLASTATELAGPRSGTALGAGAVVVGSLVTLGDGVRQQPVVWQSTSGNTGWSRDTLPMKGRTGEAISVGCRSGAGCLVVGSVDGRLAAWDVRADRSGAPTARDGIPAVTVPDRASIPAPVWRGDRWTILLPTGAASLVLRSGASGWETRAGPPGVVTSAAQTASGTMYAVTTDTAGVSSLWATDDLR